MDHSVLLGLAGLTLAVGSILLGVPVAVAFLLAAVACLYFFLGTGVDVIMNVMATTFYDWTSVYSLITVPLFILMGAFLMESGIGSDLYDAIHKWLGRLPAGHAVSTLVACAGFAACSGSSVATAATMGKVCLPGMRQYGYSPRLAAGVVAAGGTLGILIPPSTVLILYGVLSGASIVKLFLAGIVPGLLLTAVWCAQTMVSAGRDPALAAARRFRYSWDERMRALAKVLPVVALFALLIGGLYVGLFGATEAAGVGAIAALAICLAMRRLDWQGFRKILAETVLISGMSFLIVIGAMVLNYFLSVAGISKVFPSMIGGLGLPPLGILLTILLFYVLIGMVMDTVSITVLTIPLVVPIVTALGYDVIWFGIVFTILIEMALITPPVGLNCFVIKSLAPDISIGEVFRGAVPFAIGQTAVIALLILFPAIVLYVPGMAK